jgi:hypothetical protein
MDRDKVKSMKRYYCTYFDRNYLIKGLALIESLKRHEKNGFLIFVVCLDEITRVILDKLNLQNVKTIPFHEIEQRDFPLLAAKQNRSLVEYYWTLTPTIIIRILENNPEIDVLTYLDADLFFYSSPDPIFKELSNHSILIHEHRFSPSLRYLGQFGKYNVGLLCFRNDRFGMEALNWWRKRCIEWCYTRFEDGKFGDQLYLNGWPTRFEGVRVLQNIGAGVAPWNHEQYTYSIDTSNNILVNGKRLIFYHFHGLSFVHSHIIVPAIHNHPLTEEIIRLCFLPYINSLSRGIESVQTVLPDYSFGLSEENILTTVHTFIAKSVLTSRIESSGIPQIPFHLDKDWDCFCSPQLKDHSPIPDKTTQCNKTVFPQKIDFINFLPHQRKSIDQEEKNPNILNQHGESLFEQGDIEEALRAFNRAIELEPGFAQAHNNLGVIYWKAEEVQKALEHFIRAMEIDPFDRDTVLNCGDLLRNLERNEEAKVVYSTYLGKYPNDEVVAEAVNNL